MNSTRLSHRRHGLAVELKVRDNSFQRVLVLRDNRTKRLRYGQVFVEGMRPLQLLVESRWPVDTFWYGDSRPLPSWALEVMGRRPETRRYSVPPDMMSELSGRSDGSPLVAVARRPAWDETSVSSRADALLVACDRPSSPGNVGTIVRCANALNASAVALMGHSADPYDPKAISASTGACFLTPVLELAGPDQLARLIEELGTPAGGVGVYAAEAGGDLPLSEARFRGPTVLLLGSERGGLSQGVRALASAAVRIESAGHVDSLNVATAAAILMYEVRRHQLGPSTDD